MEKQGDRLQAGRCNPHAYEVAIRERGALCGAKGTSVPVPAHTKEAEGLSTLSIPKDQIGQSQSHRLIYSTQPHSSLASEKLQGRVHHG